MSPAYPKDALMPHAVGVDVLDAALNHQRNLLTRRLEILVQRASEHCGQPSSLGLHLLSLKHFYINSFPLKRSILLPGNVWPGQGVQGLVLCHGHQTVLQVIVLGLLLDYSVVDDDQGLALLDDCLLQGLGVAEGIRSLDFLFVTKIPDKREINNDLITF